MTLRGTWKCPYCGFENTHIVEEATRAVEAAYCDIDLGGCDKLVVLDVREIRVEFRVRRVEGEGPQLQEDATPIVALAPTPVHVSNGTHVVIEKDLPQAMEGPLNMRLLAAYSALSDVVTRLEEGASFASLQKATRLRLISIYGEALAHHVSRAPTMNDWNQYRAAWMPSAPSIQQSYDEADQGWKGMSLEWFENGND